MANSDHVGRLRNRTSPLVSDTGGGGESPQFMLCEEWIQQAFFDVSIPLFGMNACRSVDPQSYDPARSHQADVSDGSTDSECPRLSVQRTDNSEQQNAPQTQSHAQQNDAFHECCPADQW